MSGERGGKLADWAYRNPNGLQPTCAFAEDYQSPGHLHYNVPPVRLGNEETSTDLIPPPQWHGYTGAKGFFTQQPMPSNTQLLLTGGYAPKRADISAVVNESPRSVRPTPPSVPCSTVTVAAQAGADVMTTVVRPQAHPIQVDVPDSRLWRFDGRDHTFQSAS